MIRDQHGRRTLVGWLWLILFAVIWFLVSWAVPPIGVLMCVVCLTCVLIDMGMNGAAYAEFAPYNLAGAVIALAGSGIGSN